MKRKRFVVAVHLLASSHQEPKEPTSTRWVSIYIHRNYGRVKLYYASRASYLRLLRSLEGWQP